MLLYLGWLRHILHFKRSQPRPSLFIVRRSSMQFSGLQLLDSIPLSIIITDLEGNITNANSALITLLGRDSDVMVGCPLADISIEEFHTHDTSALQAVK